MQVATRGIQATGGFVMRGYSPEVPLPSALQVVDSPWAGREAVRDQVAHDADLIKVYAAYDFRFTSDGKVVSPPTPRKKSTQLWTRLTRRDAKSPATRLLEKGSATA
jgi:hypothetical protein